jgi:hypothetical protein
VLAGLLGALACLVRPEGVLLAVILIGVRWRDRRELVRTLVPIVIVGALSVAALSAFYGTPIPQSVVAKAAIQERADGALDGERWELILRGAFLPGSSYIVLLPFVAWGAWTALRVGGAARVFSLFALAITLSYLIAMPHTWGWYFYVPLVAWTLWFALGAERAWMLARAHLSAGSERWLERFGPQLLGALAVVLVALVSRARPSSVEALVYAPMSAWAERTSKLEPSARILASDIGAIGYHWNGVVLDSVGLVWPDALRYGSVNKIIEALRPEYLLVVCEKWSLEHLEKRPDLRALYEPIARFSANGERDLDPRARDTQREWEQDYLLLRLRTP